MSTTELSICNDALIEVGADTIASLSDNNDKARTLNEQYNKHRRHLLYSHPWNFSIKRVEVSADVTNPEFKWAKRFALPADCLRVLETSEDPNEWHVEGRFIVANCESLKIAYISDITNAAHFSEGFAKALALKLAASVAYKFTQSTTLKDELEKKYLRELSFARSFDAQESVGDRVYADNWLNSRF